jgi:hypothetical protein
MLKVLESMDSGRLLTTSRWDDPNGFSTRDYADGLANSVFALCPRGNNSVDCFRVYEALEAGAIPIVEDDGRYDRVLTKLGTPAFIRTWEATHRIRHRYRERFGFSYWGQMFGEDCPLPRLTDWGKLPEMMDQLDAQHLGPRIQRWWETEKQRCCDGVRRKIDTIR